jgi:predicted PurR-regulated permease PerM
MTVPVRRDLTRTVLAVLFIGGLITAAFWVLRPFLGAAIWATMIVVATWPLMLRVQARLWNRRGLAVAVMTITLLLVLVVPLTLVIGAVVENAERFVDWAGSLSTVELPPAPEALGRVPVVGAKAVQVWNQVAAAGVNELAGRSPPTRHCHTMVCRKMGGVGLYRQFLLTVDRGDHARRRREWPTVCCVLTPPCR